MAIDGFTLDSYIGNFKTGGARAYLFQYVPIFPTGTGENIKYLVRSFDLPATTVEEMTTQWQGMDYKMAGKHTFGDFSVTFNCDGEYAVYNKFLDWLEKIHNIESNVYALPGEYMADQSMDLLDNNGDKIFTLKLIGAWPKEVGAISLDYSSTDISQFSVTFSYQYHLRATT